MDTAYGRRGIRRIGNREYAFSCEDFALICRICFPGYDVLDIGMLKHLGREYAQETREISFYKPGAALRLAVTYIFSLLSAHQLELADYLFSFFSSYTRRSNLSSSNKKKVNKSSGAHAFVSYVQKQKRNLTYGLPALFICLFLVQHEPKKISEALEDESWVDCYCINLKKLNFAKFKTARPDIMFAVCACSRGFRVSLSRILSDSDYVEPNLEGNPTTCGCQVLARMYHFSWQCKSRPLWATLLQRQNMLCCSSCCGHLNLLSKAIDVRASSSWLLAIGMIQSIAALVNGRQLCCVV
ncbi:hypothetical protein Tco_1326687 [Tanacetum coccineum]